MTKRTNKRPPPPKRQRIEAENEQNAENNANDQHPLTLRMMFNTCQEVLKKQENIEHFNTEIVDELRSVKSELKLELQLIRDDLKPKTVTAPVPVKKDIENTTDSDSKNKSAIMPTTGKYFVLKHVFKNVSNMKEDDIQWSKPEEYYGVKWRMNVRRTKEHLEFYLNCWKPTGTGNWKIETRQKDVFISNRVENKVKEEGITIFSEKSPTWGWEFIKWDVLEKDFLVNDKLTAEMHVKIEKTTGVYKDNLRNFDKTMEEFSDVVLVVNDEKFYVLKKFLAAHSSYFKALFLGHFQESKESEIKLTGIDADDFQKYLEVLYGESAIDEVTVEGILMMADMYDTPLVIRKCEEFLLEKSNKSLKKKLKLFTRYHLEGLKEQCLDKIKSVADIRSVLPEDIRELDPTIMSGLLKKSLALHKPQ